MKEYNCKLILANGQEYIGYYFGYQTSRICEVVFNTSMAGYQEIVSDPSYTYQMVVMTYPLIGNYGVTDDDYESKLKNHKRKITRIGIIAGVIMVILIIVLIVSNKKSSYTSYNEESSIRRNDSSYAEYHYFGGHIVRCSKDGIAAISYNGKQLWNSTYEINNISVEYNGSYMAVADLNGNSIYTFDKNGKRSSINTALPILQISVSKAGLVAAILEDRNAYYINMY